LFDAVLLFLAEAIIAGCATTRELTTLTKEQFADFARRWDGPIVFGVMLYYVDPRYLQ